MGMYLPCQTHNSTSTSCAGPYAERTDRLPRTSGFEMFGEHCGGVAMPTYVIFFHLTHQGLDHLRASGDRVDAAKKTFHQHGAKVKDFYSMMGQYDSMFIVEAP